MKTIIERGASWTLDETKLLLSLWGQDLVQRQATCQKRTKEVYEKISEKFSHGGYERTPDQVRTRVFNMIAEYRRILRDPSPDRMKKCIFFEALHKIYQAKHMDDVKSALDDYEPEYPYSPNAFVPDKPGSVSDNDTMDDTLLGNNNNNHDGGSGGDSSFTTDKTNNSISKSNNNNASATSDSINNNNEKSGTQNSNKQSASDKEVASCASGSTAKRVKLESPTAGSSGLTGANNEPSSSGSGGSNSKNKSSSSAPNAAANNNVARNQSLLLPHGTSNSSATSTPITKLTTSGAAVTAATGNNSTPAYINVTSSLKNVMGTTRLIGPANGNDTASVNGTPTRMPTTAAITSHQFYQAPVNTFDVTSSALLIDRMFAHLSRESENMREWIALEKDRIALERARRVQEAERDSRRERVLIDTLMKFQEQWISFITQLEPRLAENAAKNMPQLNIPPEESTPMASTPTLVTNTTTPTTAGAAATVMAAPTTTPTKTDSQTATVANAVNQSGSSSPSFTNTSSSSLDTSSTGTTAASTTTSTTTTSSTDSDHSKTVSMGAPRP